MKYNPEIHHRQSIRLKGYDYSVAGAYFVTICVQGREYLFGEISDGIMKLHDAGRMIETWWAKLPGNFKNVESDRYVIMPNHFHGIIVFVGADPRVCPVGEGAHMGAPLQRVVQWFKTMTINAYIRGVKQSDWPPFPGRLWQRNYYERIIRDESELNAVRKYMPELPM